MPSLRVGGESSAKAFATFRLSESFRRLPTKTATSRTTSIFRSLQVARTLGVSNSVQIIRARAVDVSWGVDRNRACMHEVVFPARTRAPETLHSMGDPDST